MTWELENDGGFASISNARELRALIEQLPPEKHRLLLDGAEGKVIPDIVTSDDDFIRILRLVMGTHGESKGPFLACFGSGLSKVITRGGTLAQSLSLLSSDEDQEYLLNTLGRAGLRQCIANVNDIVECLEWMYGKTDRLFLELIGWSCLFTFIHSGKGLGMVLRYLGDREDILFLDKMGKARLHDCIKTPDDLAYVFSGLNEQDTRLVISELSDAKVRQAVPTASELERLCRHYLSEENAGVLRSKYESLNHPD
jgi:hypothetical protein